MTKRRRDAESEQRAADQAWEAMLERMELGGVDGQDGDRVDADAAELARVEALLAEGQDAEVAPVSPEWIEVTVAKVTAATVADAGGAPAKVLPFSLPGWLTRVAAVVLGHWILSAAVVVGATVLTLTYFTYFSGKRSALTLSYSNAYLLLRAEEEPLYDRRSALIRVHSIAQYGIQTLQQVRREADAPHALVELATERLDYLAALLEVPAPPPPGIVDESAYEALLAARDQDLSIELRWLNLWRTAQIVESAILAIRAIPTTSAIYSEVQFPLTSLRQELQR